MKKLLTIILSLALCLVLAACGAHEVTKPAVTQTTDGVQETTVPMQATQAIQTQPQQDMCYWCGEMPVGEFETYCVNCRCLKCGELRKDAGRYLYCRQHNCNETGCEYPAFEDSQYCSEHKCSKPNCDNRRWSGSEYCAHHK